RQRRLSARAGEGRLPPRGPPPQERHQAGSHRRSGPVRLHPRVTGHADASASVRTSTPSSAELHLTSPPRTAYTLFIRHPSSVADSLSCLAPRPHTSPFRRRDRIKDSLS